MEYSNLTTMSIDPDLRIISKSLDMTILYVIVSSFGIPGNIMGIAVLLSSKKLR